jgi:drug/metabolite transporter (DMT)-like permease
MNAGNEEGDQAGRYAYMRVAGLMLANPYLLLAFASLCWSGNHIIGRAIAGHVPPIGISTVRWAIPALVLWPIARSHLRRDRPEIKPHWRLMLWLGLTGGALFSALQYVGLQYTTALNVSVLNSLTPVFIILAGTLIFRDRIAIIQVVGIATSLIGVLVIVARGSFATLAQLAFNWGDLIIVFNMAVFGIYSAYLRLRPQIHWLSFMFMLAAISAISTLPFFLWESLSGFVFQPTLLTAFAVFYVSIFPSLLAFAAWNRGVELIGANRAGPFLHIIPIYSALLASTLLGESLAIYHVVGFFIILTGVWLATHKQPLRWFSLRILQ